MLGEPNYREINVFVKRHGNKKKHSLPDVELLNPGYFRTIKEDSGQAQVINNKSIINAGSDP